MRPALLVLLYGLAVAGLALASGLVTTFAGHLAAHGITG